ncbi:MAG: RNA methyltransferase [Candidatus Cloacimonetes bacterium]|nr:RNA methyltransferase [Candidatus Cloacimonadota bacterium]
MRQFDYSGNKFGAFDFEHQIRIIRGIITEMDGCIGDPDRISDLKRKLNHYRSLLRSPLAPELEVICDDINQADNVHALLTALKPYIDRHLSLQKDDQMTIRIGNGKRQTDPDLRSRAQGMTLVLDNLRSVFNVGSIFRTAECLALGRIILCGITPTPDHPNMNKTAMNTCDLVQWTYCTTTAEALHALRQQGYRSYALETTERSATVFDTSFEVPLALVLGNEALGIDPEVLSMVDEVISVPVSGWKNSLNVGVAMAVACYRIIYGKS